MDAGSHNEMFAALLIEQLIAQGVDRFCLAPGSRSTTLALAVAQNPKAHTDIHFDERGLGFYALGMAKGLRKPVAIIVTSGTAVGNLFPAVMEASNDHVPLLLLTADRPQELRECSANQTIDQVKLFENFVRFQLDLPFSDRGFLANYLHGILAQAVYLSQFPTPGPVHINCMFRKPLFGSEAFERKAIAPRFCERAEWSLSQKTIDHWADALSHVKKGLIIAGALPHDIAPDAIFQLAEKLKWPIYADILSQLRSYTHPHLITYFDPLIQAEHHQEIEAVIHFGGRTLSKPVSQWLKNQPFQFYLHVSEYVTLMDPHYITTHRLTCPPLLFAETMQQAIFEEQDLSWLSFWKNGDDLIRAQLTKLFEEHEEISEPGTIRQIGNCLSSDHALFIANSMPIRDAEKFFTCANSGIAFFGNRGVSGIDGNIATSIGIAQGARKPLFAILGDLAFLHDMNSLALLKEAKYPICIIVINNSGGAIFSFLPVSQKQEDVFEKYFAAAHSFTFEKAGELFGIPYAHPQNRQELQEHLTHFSKDNRSIILEVTTDRTENYTFHQHIVQEIKKALTNDMLPSTRISR